MIAFQNEPDRSRTDPVLNHAMPHKHLLFCARLPAGVNVCACVCVCVCVCVWCVCGVCVVCARARQPEVVHVGLEEVDERVHERVMIYHQKKI